MRRFILMRTKKLFLFAVIFAFLAGNMCFSEEIKITTIVPNEERIIVGTVSSEMDDGDTVFGDGFSVVEDHPPGQGGVGGKYKITFDEAFPVAPTVVCTYMPTPDANSVPAIRSVRVQVYEVKTTYAYVFVVDRTGHNVVSTGAFTFIAVGLP